MKIDNPNNIEVLLHYYTTSLPHPRIHAPAVSEATQRFVRLGCIEPAPASPGCFRVTPKGEAWVTALCAVRMPVEAFVDQHGKLIKPR